MFHQVVSLKLVLVNGEYYRNDLLMEKMLPAIWGMSSDFFILQQNRAPQHIEQRTPLRCCDVKQQASLDRISGQQTHQTSIQLNLGSNTGTRLPDSNTEHRRVEGAPHRCVGRVEAESVIDKAIEQWRPRLRACVQAKGHHFEHLIK